MADTPSRRINPQPFHFMMKTLPSGARILALDLHPQRFGYAVLETPADLLDWGIRRHYRKHGRFSDLSMCVRLRSLLQIWRPSLAVVKELSGYRAARTKMRQAGLFREIRRCRIPIWRVTERDVQSVLDSSTLTKYATACILVQQFPFLASTLPPQRKIWASEDYRMGIFAAVRLALAGSGRRA